MKTIKFVKVDAKDGIPATQHPTRHGPADPLPGIVTTHWVTGSPTHYYGIVADDADTSAPGVLQEIPESEWQSITQQRRAQASADIDSAAGDARTRFVSAGYLIEEEYRQALNAVQRWRTAGSPLDSVPPEIQSGADYGDLDAESAAVEIEQTNAARRRVAALRTIIQARHPAGFFWQEPPPAEPKNPARHAVPTATTPT